jgi:hypothetical protein
LEVLDNRIRAPFGVICVGFVPDIPAEFAYHLRHFEGPFRYYNRQFLIVFPSLPHPLHWLQFHSITAALVVATP